MKPLSRRSVTTGIAAAVTAIPAVGLSIAARGDPEERIRHHTRELEKAMRDHYGVEVETLRFEATGGMKPCVFVVAHTRQQWIEDKELRSAEVRRERDRIRGQQRI